MRVVHYYAQYLSHPSGVVDAIDNWVAQSRHAVPDVQIWSARSPRRNDRSAHGTGVRCIPHVGRGRTTWLPIGLMWLLERGDLLYLHEGWTIGNTMAALLGRLRGCTVVVMPHGVYEPGITDRTRDVLGVRAALERLTLRSASHIHVFYDRERDVVSEFLGTRPEFVVFPNGAPTSSAVRPWTGAADYFLWLGRFDIEHKGLDNLLAFWAALPTPRPKLRLAGPEYRGGRERLRELSAQLGLTEDVSIERHVSGTEKGELMSGCRAYIHPSRWESCSIALLEFLAAGTPCLVSDTIHAAHELGPAGVVRTGDFRHPSTSAALQALSAVDRNDELGMHAQTWVSRSGSWDRIGSEYATWLQAQATSPRQSAAVNA